MKAKQNILEINKFNNIKDRITKWMVAWNLVLRGRIMASEGINLKNKIINNKKE